MRYYSRYVCFIFGSLREYLVGKRHEQFSGRNILRYVHKIHRFDFSKNIFSLNTDFATSNLNSTMNIVDSVDATSERLAETHPIHSQQTSTSSGKSAIWKLNRSICYSCIYAVIIPILLGDKIPFSCKPAEGQLRLTDLQQIATSCKLNYLFFSLKNHGANRA